MEEWVYGASGTQTPTGLAQRRDVGNARRLWPQIVTEMFLSKARHVPMAAISTFGAAIFKIIVTQDVSLLKKLRHREIKNRRAPPCPR
jgi:hypothetical protein